MESSITIQTLQKLNGILDIEQRLTGIDYLRTLARNIAQAFTVKFVLIGHTPSDENNRVETDVVWAVDDFAENFTYSLQGTPCERVLSGKRVCVYAAGVAGSFPDDELLVQMGVESYVGAPMLTREGVLSGLLVLLDDKPIENADFFSAVIDFLAARIKAELDKYHSEELLKRQVAEKTRELEQSNLELRKALSEIKTLRGIIPICANCKRVRDDEGYREQVDSYVSRHTEALFSHGICPDCALKLYGKRLPKKDRND